MTNQQYSKMTITFHDLDENRRQELHVIFDKIHLNWSEDSLVDVEELTDEGV